MQKAIREKTVPKCLRETCGGLVKPEIVFFGEQLPAEFFANRMLPAEADLCIVMGTSLTVQPFASLPLFCREATPRVLINMDPVGDLGSRADDVLMLEDCDSGVRRLAEACGWLEELESLWAETAPKGKPEKEEAAKEKPKKSRDELLEEEVDKLTKQVEESLSLGKAQHEWLANHVDNKFARIQEQEETVEPTKPATTEPESEKQAPETETEKQVSETKTEKQAPETKAEATKENPDGEGLQHVFPWLSKKASL